MARFIGYLLVPLHTGVFAQDQYGIVNLIFAAIALFNVLFTMGMESAYIRYAKDREKAADIFKSLQTFLLCTSLVLVAVIWFANPLISPLIGLPSGDPLIWMMLGILLFDTLAVVPFAELRVNRQPKLFAVIKTGNVLVNLGLNFYLILGLGMGIEAVFISNLAASLLTVLVTFVVTLPMFKGSFDKAILRKALYFGLPFIPAGFGHVINELLDRFFLKGMSDAETELLYGPGYSGDDLVGIYSACYKLAVFMLLLVQMFRMAWQPFFMRQAGDDSAGDTFSRTFNAFNVAAAAIFLGVALFAEYIVALPVPFTDYTLVDQKYWMGLEVVPVLLAAYWFQGWYINFSAGIFISETTSRLPQITLFGATVTVIANLILVPEMGMMGAALATVISYAGMAALIYYYSVQSYKVPYKPLRGLLIMGLCAAAVYIKPVLTGSFLTDLVASSLLFVATLALVLIFSYRSVTVPSV